MKACEGAATPIDQPPQFLSRAEAVRIGAVAVEEELQSPEQSYEGMAGAVVDALHHLGVLPLAEPQGGGVS